jgi:catechol 2,3-dioxygenase-like lactoylglutathione lyase family enzyme
MSPAVQRMVAVTYVRDIDASRAFYQLLGFHQRSAGKAETSAWSMLYHEGHSVLLTSTRPPLRIPRLPLLFYFFFDDLEAVLAALERAGLDVTRLGRAPHALGGEAKVMDPDGNTILLGQRERTAAQEAEEDSSRFSLLREAADLVAAGGGAPERCGVSEPGGQACGSDAEVRLADAAGTAVWACLVHAEEILVMVPGSFVAADEGDGIAGFLARRDG